MNQKKLCTYVLCFTLLFLLVVGTVLEQRHLSSQVIRLHILANSDSEEDQTVKLRVRDALLGRIGELTADCTNREEAAERLMEHAAELGSVAASVSGQPVTVSLGKEAYETRHYENFSLPAGTYLSLRIGIGAAEGRNWWCVAFPSVCTAATAEELETEAVSAGLDGSDLHMMTDDTPDVQIRYFFLELLSKLKDVFRG